MQEQKAPTPNLSDTEQAIANAKSGLTEPTPLCDIKGCPNEAKVHPVLVLRQSRHKDVQIRACMAKIHLCWGCAKHARVETFLTDDLWNQMRKMFIAKGKMPPKLQLTRLDTTPIGSSESTAQSAW